jgi:hypothetical protein
MIIDSYDDQPNVLFLRGCFAEDCSTIEDIFDERLVGGITEEAPYETTLEYDKIPEVFTCMQTWIKKTNLKCWSCDCCFQNIPVFIPLSINDIDGNAVIDVLGNFCSWSCAASYIIREYTGNERWEKMSLLRILYKIFTGRSIDVIEPSPPKTIMVQYGGKKSLQSYKKDLDVLNTNYNSTIEHNKIKNISR